MYNGVFNQGMCCIYDILWFFFGCVEYEIFDVCGKFEVFDFNFDFYIFIGGFGNLFEGDGDWDVKYYVWLQVVWIWN